VKRKIISLNKLVILFAFIALLVAACTPEASIPGVIPNQSGSAVDQSSSSRVIKSPDVESELISNTVDEVPEKALNTTEGTDDPVIEMDDSLEIELDDSPDIELNNSLAGDQEISLLVALKDHLLNGPDR
jgi:hypothetical protein